MSTSPDTTGTIYDIAIEQERNRDPDPLFESDLPYALSVGLLNAGDWASTGGGSVQLIDERGRTYSVAGDQEVENLGYGSVPEVVVPDAWNRLFRSGPDLSILAALCPPKATGESGDDAGATCS